MYGAEPYTTRTDISIVTLPGPQGSRRQFAWRPGYLRPSYGQSASLTAFVGDLRHDDIPDPPCRASLTFAHRIAWRFNPDLFGSGMFGVRERHFTGGGRPSCCCH